METKDVFYMVGLLAGVVVLAYLAAAKPGIPKIEMITVGVE